MRYVTIIAVLALLIIVGCSPDVVYVERNNTIYVDKIINDTDSVNTVGIAQGSARIAEGPIRMIEITAAQVRAARAMVKWTQQDLARASGVSLPTIKRMEARDGPIRGITDNVVKIQRALE